MLAFWNNLAGFDGLVILIIALLIFGKRLPEVMRSLGKGISEFKKGMNEVDVQQPYQQQPYQQVPYQQPQQQVMQPQIMQPAPPPAPPSEPVKDLPPKQL